jgi:hypothetical protein
MSRSERLLGWLEKTSDWLSPIVVKEVRQIVRGREFTYSFGASLVAGLAVAFFGAADSLTGTGTSGRWTFGALMGCLAVLGLAVVPLGAFAALRVERIEQTLELITLTALTPRRVVIGKLLAQGVKLTALFAAVAPFVAMSFLLGGIDFATILVALVALFMWSLWMSSAGLFLSSLARSRAMAALAFGAAAILLLVVFTFGRMLFFVASRGGYVGGPVVGMGLIGSQPWWFAMMATFCLATMVNLVLLAENRLALPTESKVTPLRVGFLVQFLLIVGWNLSFINEPAAVRSDAIEVLGVIGGLHLALVAMFAVTEDLVVLRRMLLRSGTASRWNLLLAMFHPGGGRGALYVLVQMAILLTAAWLLQPAWLQVRWLLGICGYICFFTGVPTIALRLLRPSPGASFRLRVALLLLLALAMVTPDIVHYVAWQPDVLDLRFSARHLINPIRTPANWTHVEARQWLSVPLLLGLVGLVSYGALIHLGTSMTAEVAPRDPQASAAEAGEPGSADVLY